VFAHSQRADLLSADESGEIFLLLLRRAVEHQLIDAELRVRSVREPNASARSAQLFHNNTMRLVAHGQAAELLVGCYAQEAGLTKLPPHVVGELIDLVRLCSKLFGDFAAHKISYALAEFIEVRLCGWDKVLGVLGRCVATCGEGEGTRGCRAEGESAQRHAEGGERRHYECTAPEILPMQGTREDRVRVLYIAARFGAAEEAEAPSLLTGEDGANGP
jgi:hypothetical protein